MRVVLAGLLLAACGGKATAPAPAWPESAGHVAPETWEQDGGESLEPKHDTMVEDSQTDAEDDDDLQAAIDGALEDQATDPPADDDAEEMIIVDDEGDGDGDDDDDEDANPPEN